MTTTAWLLTRSALLSSLLIPVLVPGCTVSRADGESCDAAGDCRSERCTDGFCAGKVGCTCEGGACPEEGAPSSGCQPGWLCVGHQGSWPWYKYSTSCAATCGSCPLNAGCSAEQKLCVPNPHWRNPVVELTGPSNGSVTPLSEPVSFTAVSSSPIQRPIVRHLWRFGDASATPREGDAEITHQFTADDGAHDTSGYVGVQVEDADGNSGSAYVYVQLCVPTGWQCQTPLGMECCSGQFKCVDTGTGQETCQR